jgi:hypothetical protein
MPPQKVSSLVVGVGPAFRSEDAPNAMDYTIGNEQQNCHRQGDGKLIF